MKRTHLLLFTLPLVVGAFYMRSLASWRPKRVFQSEVQAGPTTQIGPVSQLVFSQDGRMLFVGTGTTQRDHDNTALFTALYALDTETGFASRWQWKAGKSAFRLVRHLQYSPDTPCVVLDGSVQLWAAKTGKVLIDYDHDLLPKLPESLMFMDGAYVGIWLGAISPDKKWLVGGPTQIGPSAANRVAIYRNLSPNQDTPHFSLFGEQEWAANYVFSPDSKTLLVGVGDVQGVHLDFYDTNTWKRRSTWTEWKMPATGKKRPSPQYYMLQWSRNGRFLLSWWYWEKSRQQHMIGLTLWRASDGHKLASLQSGLPGWGTAWRDARYELQEDGRVLTWTDRSPSMYLSQGQNFNFGTKPLLTLLKESISAATLSPDGAFVVAGTISSRVYTQRLK